VVAIVNLPPPQKRAALNILPEYRGLKLSELTESDPPPEEKKEEEEKDPQAVLLSKIANLRKAINEVGAEVVPVPKWTYWQI
jgi:hypothetical protein